MNSIGNPEKYETQDEDPQGREHNAEKRARYRLISNQLRRMFDEVLAEPIPDEFSEFLRKIDDQRGEKREESA